MSYEDAVGMIMKLRPGQTINCCDFEYLKHKLHGNYKSIRSRIHGLELILEDAAARQEAHENGHANACAELVASQRVSLVEEPIHVDGEPDPMSSMFVKEDVFGGNEEMGQTGDQEMGSDQDKTLAIKPARPKAMVASQVKGGKKTARKRPQSIKMLAKSHASQPRPPPMCSSWQESSPENVGSDLGDSPTGRQPMSPRCPKLRPKPIDSDVVAERLDRLMDQRRVVGQMAWNVQSNRLQERLMDDIHSVHYQPSALRDLADRDGRQSPKHPAFREPQRWDEPQFIS